MRTHKSCSQCSQFLPLNAFYADRRRQDGKRADCATCNRVKGSIREKTPEGRKANLRRVTAFYARQRAKLCLAIPTQQ